VNVLLVPAHPGFPGQIPQSRKTVVCVCAMDRSRWRKQIGMIDDHNECEWVNVSSGTDSPGLSRTNSIEL